MELNREIVERWIAALESGNYEQGRHKLCGLTVHGPRYCCLGVLCEILPEVTQEDAPGPILRPILPNEGSNRRYWCGNRLTVNPS